MNNKRETLKALLLPDPMFSFTNPGVGSALYYRIQGFNECLQKISERIDALETAYVYGYTDQDGDKAFGTLHDKRNDTHSALLICIEPLKRPKVSKDEIIRLLLDVCANDKYGPNGEGLDIGRCEALAKRIERDGLEGA